MAAQRHLIKKYANRKLYDTETSRYITLEGISRLVRDGHEIEVIDRDTGRDLTPLILSQIVMGEEKRTETNGAEAAPDRGQALFEYVRRTLMAPAAMVSTEVERRRAEFEDLVVLVERALARHTVARRSDIDAVNARIDALERRLDRLQASREPSPPRRRMAGARR
jgi:PHB/PHA accumulation regulator DNA-binding domain